MKSGNLQKNNTKVAVVLPHLLPGGIETAAIRLVNELHGQQFHFLIILGQKEGPLIRQLCTDIPVIVLKNRRAFRSVAELRRIIRDQKIDAIYSGTNARNLATLLATQALPARQRPKVIISEHTSPREYLQEAKLARLRVFLMRRLYPMADLLVSPTDGLAAGWLQHLGITRPGIATLPNPILDQEQLALARRPADAVEKARNRAHILCIGRLHPAKGQDVLIRAFAKAVQSNPDLVLSIFGDGAYRQELEQLAGRLNLSDHIDFRGYVPDIAGDLARAGLLVVPSRREGFGNVVVEALAQGTPVLATDCPGPRALLEQSGAAGCIVGIEDVDALAAAMVGMTRDPEAPIAARQAGRKLIDRYEVRRASQAFAAQLEELLETRHD